MPDITAGAAIEEAIARTREEMLAEFDQRRARGSESLPSIRADIAAVLSTKVIRSYIRAELVEPVVKRLYDIGMGIERFEVPTMVGSIVRVPAQARTQVGALKLLLESGIPRTNLVDEEGNRIPGVFVVGALQLDEARRLSQGDLYIGEGKATVTQAQPLDPMEERIERGEFELVEVDETANVTQRDDPDAPAPPITPVVDTPEQRILARRQARKNGNGNGNGRYE